MKKKLFRDRRYKKHIIDVIPVVEFDTKPVAKVTKIYKSKKKVVKDDN